MGGIRYVTGEPDRPPVQTGISLGDALASLYAVIAALMAVHARDARGRSEGQVVDVALYEAVFNLMESMIREFDVAGIVRERTGAALPRIAPSNSYCTGDGSYVAVGAKSDAIFKRLVKAIGRPELGDDPRYETNADRTEHAEELDDLSRTGPDGTRRTRSSTSSKRWMSRSDRSTRSPTSWRIPSTRRGRCSSMPRLTGSGR